MLRLFERHSIAITDHAKERYGGHPVTFGDGDTILTGSEDHLSKQSLDYIFSLHLPGVPSKARTGLQCKPASCKVEPFIF